MGVPKMRFNSGEWSPELQARYDLEGYAGACKKLVNFIPKPEGGIYNRGGLKYASSGVTLGATCRMVPFVYKNSQEYMLAFTTSGAVYVLKNKTPLLLSGSPVTVTNGHPLADNVLNEMDFAQTEDTLYCTHNSVPPFKITRNSAVETTWTRTNVVFGTSVAKPNAPTGGTVDPASYSFYLSKYSVDTGEESLLSTNALAIGGDTLTMADPTLAYGYKLYVFDEESLSYRLVVLMPQGDYVYTLAASFDSADYPLAYPYRPGDDYYNYNFDSAGDYPSLVTIYNQRMVFAATVNDPRRLFFSQVGLPENFLYTDSLIAKDAFSRDLSTPAGEELCWLVSREKLLVGTTGGEYVVGPATGSALTPTNIAADKNSEYGSAKNIKPQVSGRSVLFVDRTARAIRDQEYTYTSEGYSAIDVGIRARHLFKGLSITALAYQKNILWALVGRQLIGMSYDKEQQVYAWHRHKTGVLENDTIDDIEVLRNRTTGEDDLYIFSATRGSIEVLTDHLPADDRFLENEDRADLRLGNFLDYSYTSDVGEINIATLTTGSSTSVTTTTGHGLTAADENTTFVDVSGIPNFATANGRFRFKYVSSTTIALKEYNPLTVDILDCDDVVTDDSVVSSLALTNRGGVIRIPTTTHSGFTHLYGQSGVYAVIDGIVDDSPTISAGGVITVDPPASIVHAGIPYTAKVEPVDFLYDTQTGNIAGRERLVSSVILSVKNTRCVQVANTESDTLTDYAFPDADLYDQPKPLYTGDIEVFVEGETERSSSVYIQCSDPVSCHILRMDARVDAGDD